MRQYKGWTFVKVTDIESNWTNFHGPFRSMDKAKQFARDVERRHPYLAASVDMIYVPDMRLVDEFMGRRDA